MVTTAALLLSLSIEILQAYLPTRNSSLLDLLCNTFGGMFVGAVASFYYSRYRLALKCHPIA